MQTRITPEEMQAAAQQLAKSEQGRVAMAKLLDWLENKAPDLSLLNQRAFLALLGAVWSGRCDEAQKVMRDAIASESPRAREV